MRVVLVLAAALATMVLGSLPTALGGDALPGTLDTTPPHVVSVEPEGNVSVEEHAFHVRFNETMNTSVADAAHLMHGAEEVAVETSWIENGTVLVVSLSGAGHLEWESNYTLTVTTNATDIAGNALASNYTHAFSTEEIPVVPTQPSPISPWIVVVLALIILVVVFFALYPSKKS